MKQNTSLQMQLLCRYYANCLPRQLTIMSGASGCKGGGITVLRSRCTSLKYSDLGFAFRSCIVFLCTTFRFQVSCFSGCWPKKVLWRHQLLWVYKAIVQHCWVGQEDVHWKAYKWALFPHITGEGIVACNMHLWKSIWEKALFVLQVGEKFMIYGAEKKCSFKSYGYFLASRWITISVILLNWNVPKTLTFLRAYILCYRRVCSW